jgi:hypothetical protein
MNIYFLKKFVWFVFVMLKSPKSLYPHHDLSISGNPLMAKGASIWFCNVLTCDVGIILYWIILSLKIQQNKNLKC